MSLRRISAKFGYIFLEIFHLELGVLAVIEQPTGIKIDKNASRNGIHLLLFLRIQRCLQSLGQLAR